jgi:hypothetical protein
MRMMEFTAQGHKLAGRLSHRKSTDSRGDEKRTVEEILISDIYSHNIQTLSRHSQRNTNPTLKACPPQFLLPTPG